ncbi:MAG: hypothetical protein MUO23_07480 [Anaerolineales bacterium]|nr:hypothetical protein [Anaerolineales bacterium]
MRKLCRTGAVLSLAILAGCNFPAGLPAPTDEPPTPFAIPPTYQPSTTPAPAAPTLPAPTQETVATPTPSPSPLPSVSEISVSPLAGEVICRFGPGIEYTVEGKVLAGQEVLATGRNLEATWLLVGNPSREGKNCWVPAAEMAGAEQGIALPELPPPVNIVTKITVTFDPKKEDIPCAELPYKFNVTFTITTTGPATVKYEADSSEGQAIGPTLFVFASGGKKTFTDTLKVGSAGEPWYRVDVLSPNVISAEGKAKLACTP